MREDGKIWEGGLYRLFLKKHPSEINYLYRVIELNITDQDMRRYDDEGKVYIVPANNYVIRTINCYSTELRVDGYHGESYLKQSPADSQYHNYVMDDNEISEFVKGLKNIPDELKMWEYSIFIL